MKGEGAIRKAISTAEIVDGGKISRRRDRELSRLDCTDLGNGERLRRRYGDELLFVEQLGQLAWAKTHWSRDGAKQHWLICAHKTAEAIKDEAREAEAEHEELYKRSSEPNPPQGLDLDIKRAETRAKQLWIWAQKSSSRDRINGMIDCAAPYLTRRVDELDANPFLFNVQNGTLELPRELDKPVRLRKHSKRDLITCVAPIGYNPDAEATRWRGFIDWAFPPDRDGEKAKFLQRLAGLTLTGDTGDQAFYFFWGGGGNGKSVVTGVLQYILGDYAAVLPFATLVANDRRDGSGASPDIAELPNKRAAFCSETNPGARLDIGRVNALTGGEKIPARHLNRDFFRFRPSCKLIVSFNNKPIVADPSDGVWRRMMLLHFTQILPREQWQKNLAEHLFDSEGPGILNWIIDGFLRWREVGIDPPPAVRAAIKEYRAQQDPVGEFLEMATVRRAEAVVRRADLYGCYEGWCRFNSTEPITGTAFGRSLAGRGIERRLGHTVSYAGLEIRDDLDWDWNTTTTGAGRSKS